MTDVKIWRKSDQGVQVELMITFYDVEKEDN